MLCIEVSKGTNGEVSRDGREKGTYSFRKANILDPERCIWFDRKVNMCSFSEGEYVYVSRGARRVTMFKS